MVINVLVNIFYIDDSTKYLNVVVRCTCSDMVATLHSESVDDNGPSQEHSINVSRCVYG